MPDPAQTAQQFADRFAEALPATHTKPTKSQETAYYHRLTPFIHRLSSTKDIDACIAQYLSIYGRFSPDDPRSKVTFDLLLRQRIKNSTGDAVYLHDLRDILNQKQPSSPIWKRFDQLEQKEKSEVRSALEDALDNLPLTSGPSATDDSEKDPAVHEDPKTTKAGSSKTAKEFGERFHKAMTAPGTTKQQEGVFYPLTRFIHQLKKTADVDACLEKYLALYKDLSPDDPRSKMIFAVLLTQRIQNSDADVPYLLRLKDTLEQRDFSSPIRVRFDQMEDNEKNQIRVDLRNALEKSASIFDELKKAYADAHDQKQGSITELFNFDPLPGGALETSFRTLTKKCTKAWEACRGDLSQSNWKEFEDTFQNYTDFLKQNYREKLKLFQILKWCREPYVGAPITAVSGRHSVHAVTSPSGTDIQNEFCFQTVYMLFLRANNLVNPKRYRYQFSDDEEKLLLGPLRRTLHASNYRNRLLQGTKKPGEFHASSASRIWLLLFAQSKDLSVITDEKLMEIAKIYEDAGLKKIPLGKLADKRLNLGELPHLDWAKNIRYKIGDKLGAGSSQTEVIYFEREETGSPRIYLEYTGMRGALFELDLGRFIDRVEATPRLILWEDNKGLLVLIAEYWAFLFTMFMPGIGYFGIFLEGGFTAVVKQLVLDKVVGSVLEQMNQAGMSSTGGPGIAADAAALLLGRKKAIIERAKALENRLGRLAEKEFLEEAEREGAHLSEQELKELRFNDLRTQINQDERTALDTERRVHDKIVTDMKDLDRQEWEALDKDEQERAKDLIGQRGITNRGMPQNPKVHTVVGWQTGGPEPAAARQYREELAREIERRSMPEGTTVGLPMTPRTQYGYAQNVIATPKGSQTVFERDIELNFPDPIRRELGLPLRDPKVPRRGVVGIDGMAYKSSEKYYMLEHKEIENWAKSYYSGESTVKQLDDMLQRHLNVARVLRNYGCQGFRYSTNMPQMKILLKERIDALAKDVKGWFPLALR